MFVDVVLLSYPYGPYIYASDKVLDVGNIVQVNLKGAIKYAVVYRISDNEQSVDIVKIKHIVSILPYKLEKKDIDFINKVAAYNINHAGAFLECMIHTNALEKAVKKEHMYIIDKKNIILNEEQEAAYIKIMESYNKFAAFLLNGVTGSGKTEVYLAVSQTIINQNKQVLILVPEISITPQFIERIKNKIGYDPAIWHSAITPAKKRMFWCDIMSGKAIIVVAARSGLFLPFCKLGLIVVDEEHDTSYKQETNPKYNARDMAVLRANNNNIPIILGSATPSLESKMCVANNKYTEITMKNKFWSNVQTNINIIHMKNNDILSDYAIEKIKENILNRKQVIVYLNKRGYAPIYYCSKCYEKIECYNCSAYMNFHKIHAKVVCHYCGLSISASPKCIKCNSMMNTFGIGIEQLEEYIKKIFDGTKVCVASSDTIKSQNDMEVIYNNILTQEYDIILATQILSKGHHFPNIGLVVFVSADIGFSDIDFRTSEKMYQLIQQIIGRTGREKHGEAIIQTRTPEHKIFKSILENNSNLFYKEEMYFRQIAKLPPFAKIAHLNISGYTEEEVKKYVNYIYVNMPEKEDLIILGPAACYLYRMKNKFRMSFLIKHNSAKKINIFLNGWISKLKKNKKVSVEIEIDPLQFI